MSATPTWSTPEMARIVELVADRTGLVFPATRRDSVEEAVRHEMRRLGLRDEARYRAVLAAESAALDALAANLTIGETYFFREPAQLDVIRRDVFPALAAQQSVGRAARVWSAACASGEEAYTLAIMMREHGLLDRGRVLGTDISRDRLATARSARYGRWSLRSLTPDVVARYFERRGKQFQLDPAIRRGVEFRYLNLAEDTYPASSTGVWGMDLILCRNVLIYFDRATVRRVAARLIASLADGGWLLLGASDPPIGDLVPCEVVVTGAGLGYRKPLARTIATRCLAAQAFSVATPPPPPAGPLAPAESPLVARAPSPPPAASASLSDEEEIARQYAGGDYGAVVDLARRARDGGASGVALSVMLVRALANLGRLDEAGRECAAALERHRASAELLYLHSLLLAEAQQPDEAASAARRALYLDRSMTVAHLALATVLARLGDRDAARRSFRNAEALLAELPPDAPVPASDGEPAHRLLEIARAQRALLCGAAA